MSDKQTKLIQDLLKKKLKEPLSREEALRSLQGAGILDKNGEYTEPYKELKKLTQG